MPGRESTNLGDINDCKLRTKHFDMACAGTAHTCGVMQPLRVELPLQGLQLSVGLIQRLFPPPTSGASMSLTARGFTSGLGSVLAMMLWDDDCAGCAAVLGVCLPESPPEKDCHPAHVQTHLVLLSWHQVCSEAVINYLRRAHLIAVGHSESC